MNNPRTLRSVVAFAVAALLPTLCSAEEWRVVAEAFPTARTVNATRETGYRVVAAVTAQGQPVAKLGKDDFAVEAYACHAQRCTWKPLQVASVDDTEFVESTHDGKVGAYTLIAVPRSDGPDASDPDNVVMLQVKVYRPTTTHAVAHHVVALVAHRQAAATLVRYTATKATASDDVFEGLETQTRSAN